MQAIVPGGAYNHSTRVIKRAFSDNKMRMLNEIHAEWSKVRGEDTYRSQMMQSLVEEVTKFWLEMNQLRPRVYLSISEPNQIPRRSNMDSLDENGILHLTIKTGLRMSGDSFGEDLDVCRTVMEQEAEYGTFKPF